MGVRKLELHYTYDDYKLWDGDWELYDGVAVAMSPAPMRKHQSIASKIIAALDDQLNDCPNDLIAKVYKLDGKEYDKQGDFSKEPYNFENTTYKI